MPKIITFKSAEDAIAVASHLYCSLVDSMILAQDNKAAELAISLAGVEVERVEGMSCPLPFPAHKRECKDSDKIRIYVQCLSAWSYGLMHGIWLDACRQVDEIRSDIDWLLSWSPWKKPAQNAQPFYGYSFYALRFFVECAKSSRVFCID
jgi:hypothetical protein